MKTEKQIKSKLARHEAKVKKLKLKVDYLEKIEYWDEYYRFKDELTKHRNFISQLKWVLN